MGSTTKGFVRASALVPRDSANVAIWTLDQSAALLSPNGDGTSDAFVVAARLSEPAATTLVVRNAAGRASSPRPSRATSRASPGTSSSPRAPTRPTARTRGPSRRPTRGATATSARTGSFTIDCTAPVTTATVAATAGGVRLAVSPPSITLEATDAATGVQADPLAPRRRHGLTYTPPRSVSATAPHLRVPRRRQGRHPGGMEVARAQDRHQRPGDHPAAHRPRGQSRRHLAVGRDDQPVGQGHRVRPRVAARPRRRRAGRPAGRRPGRRRRRRRAHGPGPRPATSRGTWRRRPRHLHRSTRPHPSWSSPRRPRRRPTVTPNGDTTGEQVTFPFSVSEAGSRDGDHHRRRREGRAGPHGAGRRRRGIPRLGRPDRRRGSRSPTGGTRSRSARRTPRATPATRRPPWSTSTRPSRASPARPRCSTRRTATRSPATRRRPGRSARPATVTVRVLDATRQSCRAPDDRQGAARRRRELDMERQDRRRRVGARAARTGSSSRPPTAPRSASQAASVTADAFRITTSTPGATRGKPITSPRRPPSRSRPPRSSSCDSPASPTGPSR